MLRLKIPRTVALVALMSIPSPGTAEPVAPNEVCLYEYENYVNKLGCFSLKPGMRQLLVPHLGKANDRATSFQVGENVEVVAFLDANFEIGWWPIWPLRESCPHYFEGSSSLIVAPRGQGIKGVNLYSGPGFLEVFDEGKFLPLPEYLKDTEARFELTGHWNDNADSLTFYGEVEVVLFRDHNFEGKPVTLPGSGYYDDPPGTHEPVESWNLEQFELFDEVSSVIVRDVHALKAIQTPIKRLLPPPERGGQGPAQVHRAPPAPKQLAAPPYPGPLGAIVPTPSMKPAVPLASLITGNTLKVRVGAQGVSWSIYFRPDNAVFARSNQGKEDSGKWSISGGVYCTQYQHLNNSKRVCYSLARVGDQLRVHKAADGQQVGTAEIVQGNPERLDHPGSEAARQRTAPPPEALPVPIPLPTPEGSRISAAELGNLIRGNTLKVRPAGREVILSIYFGSDGVVFARSDRGMEDTGSWMVKEDLYCTQYQRLSGGRQACFWLAREGQELRVHRSEDERLVGVAEVLQGDARHLGQ